jgi:folate-binding protein YgfZ
VTLRIDRSSWGRIKVTGGDRIRFLQGMTTVNVEKLAPGTHAWGAILNPKGRVLSVVNIAMPADAADESVLVSCEGAIADKTAALLDKYAVMDDVAFERVDAPTHQVWTDPASVWTAPLEAGAGVMEDAAPAAELLRIRAGFPRYGVDVDEDHFPFETPLAQFLDYKKGCYVGQEPVFRVYAQGQAAKQQRAIELEGTEPVGHQEIVAHAAKSNAGIVTSAALDEANGRVVALAYLHKTTWDDGGSVTVGGRAGVVHALPYGT